MKTATAYLLLYILYTGANSSFKTISPRTRILVMGNLCDCGTVFNAIKAGAEVFIPEDRELNGLVEILKALLENDFIPSFVALKV